MKRPLLPLALAATAFAAAILVPSGAVAQKKAVASAVPSFARDVAPVVTKFCGGCHGGKNAPGGINFSGVLNPTAALKQAALWQKVAKNVQTMRMPPEGMPAPSKAQRAALVGWVDGAFKQDCRLADPGRVTIRRMNRAEYDNTIRDLTGLDISPADDFPSDDVGYGFDNIGDVLSTSPLLMERYMAAAERVAKLAIRVPRTKTIELRGDSFRVMAPGAADREGRMFFFSTGIAEGKFDAPLGGVYNLRFLMGQQAAGPEVSRAEIKLDGRSLGVFDVSAPLEASAWTELPLKLDAGPHAVTVQFLNDFYREKSATEPQQDRNMALAAFQAVGPKESVQSYPPLHARLIPSVPPPSEQETAATKALATFARSAYRRPLRSGEADRLLSIYRLARKAGEGYEAGIRLGVQAVLSSPNFLFRAELDGSGSEKGRGAIGAYDLASRLSYFIWSSMPDAGLLARAGSGSLSKPAVLAAEVERMLDDPKAARLTENFATQWLQLRKLALFEPDRKRFPEFDEKLRADMLGETTAYFDFVRSGDRSILEFVDSKYTFLNARLAKLYGLPPVAGDELRKVAVSDPRRGGVLTQAAVLAATSNPTRTSPTKRGRWILEQILGSPPPPPPPGVGNLSDDKKITDAMSLRQRMEEHRKNPSCGACHKRMDALGFGFENYDPIGRWRTRDGTFAVDASATLPDGRSFSSPAQLKSILLTQKEAFARAFAEKLLTFALGRGVEDADSCNLDAIVKKTAPTGYKLHSFVLAVVQSDPFLKRRSDGR